MKQIVLLIAIYSLIIHQAHKDINVKASRKKVPGTNRLSSNPIKVDRNYSIDNISYKPVLFKKQVLTLNSTAKPAISVEGQLIWPEEINSNLSFTPAYYPFQ